MNATIVMVVVLIIMVVTGVAAYFLLYSGDEATPDVDDDVPDVEVYADQEPVLEDDWYAELSEEESEEESEDEEESNTLVFGGGKSSGASSRVIAAHTNIDNSTASEEDKEKAREAVNKVNRAMNNAVRVSFR